LRQTQTTRQVVNVPGGKWRFHRLTCRSHTCTCSLEISTQYNILSKSSRCFPGSRFLDLHDSIYFYFVSFPNRETRATAATNHRSGIGDHLIKASLQGFVGIKVADFHAKTYASMGCGRYSLATRSSGSECIFGRWLRTDPGGQL